MALSFYQNPEHYEVAFDWRRTSDECGALLDLAARLGRGAVSRFLEPACGPAYHLQEMARRGLTGVGVELSDAMVRHTTTRLEELGLSDRARILHADMRRFTLPEPADLAFIAINSFAYLLNLDDMLAHLHAVAAALRPHALYVIELSHPRKYWLGDRLTDDTWVSERGGLKVEMHWDCGRRREIDPLTQIVTIRWQYDAVRGNQRKRYKGAEHMRVVTAQEIVAMVRLSGVFEIVDWLGAMTGKVPFDNEPPSWRMIPVLRRLP